MSARDTTPCQRCDGKGTIGPVHINRGDEPHTWEMMTCRACAGSGVWTEAQAIAARNGNELRQRRIERGESLRDAAARLGISAVELSSIEQGRAIAEGGKQ